MLGGEWYIEDYILCMAGMHGAGLTEDDRWSA